MRRLRSRALPVLLLGAVLALAGCARSGSAAGSGSGPPGPAGSGSAYPVSHCPGGVRTGTVTRTEQDRGAVCLTVGTHLEIYLHGTADDRWSDPVPDKAGVLRPEASGKGALMVGVSAGFFEAAQRGLVEVDATRAAGQRFQLTVAVY